jgi:hypothetical protein
VRRRDAFPASLSGAGDVDPECGSNASVVLIVSAAGGGQDLPGGFHGIPVTRECVIHDSTGISPLNFALIRPTPGSADLWTASTYTSTSSAAIICCGVSCCTSVAERGHPLAHQGTHDTTFELSVLMDIVLRYMGFVAELLDRREFQVSWRAAYAHLRPLMPV